MNPQIVTLLRCPRSGGLLRLAEPSERERIGLAIRAGSLRSCAGAVIGEEAPDYLICRESELVYPVQNGIPVLLVPRSFHWSEPSA